MTRLEMVNRKDELKLSYAEIAEQSGVPVSTVRKVLEGYTKNPGYKTIEALEKVLNPFEGYVVQEEVAAYDFDAQNGGMDGIRCERINGKIYFLASPTIPHALITHFIDMQLSNHIAEKGLDCTVLPGPVDFFYQKNHNCVIPDLSVVCTKELQRRGIFEPPKLVVEVVSSDAKHDYIEKLGIYMQSGICEYWIVDPDKQKITVYCFTEHESPEVYSFDDKVPVGIFGGGFYIDFPEAKKWTIPEGDTLQL